MAETLNTVISLQLSAALSNAGALANAQFPLNLPTLIAVTLANGAAAGQAQTLYTPLVQPSLASSASTSLSMYNFGGATDPLGNAIANSKIKFLIIQNLSATESDYLLIGGDGTSAAWVSPFGGSNTAVMKILGGGSLVLVSPGAAGYPVVNTTNHLLKIANGGAGSISYNIIAIGA